MRLSDEAVEKILGISRDVPLTADAMARQLTVTFFPSVGHHYSSRVRDFTDRLHEAFIRLGVRILPYEEALIYVSRWIWIKRYIKACFNNIVVIVRRFFNLPETKYFITLKLLSQIRVGKKIRRGVAVIALGEGEAGNLPMDHVVSFSDGNIVTVIDMPPNINETTDFYTHFNTALNLFAHHVTNIIIGVGDKSWILYNFNASHPIYTLADPLDEHLLRSLIPKLAAPIRPPRLSEFVIHQGAFETTDELHLPFIEDLIESGKLFAETGLYPKGKQISDLPFRNELYQWMGKVHLDDRNGMSYGFLARQLPVRLPRVLSLEEAKTHYPVPDSKDFFQFNHRLFVVISLPAERVVVEVPNIWVLTLRSGTNKTSPHPVKDIVKMGLVDGKMMLETPKGLRIDRNYRPTFDTKVILAHAVGGALFAAIAKHMDSNSRFAKQMETSGMAISHWHGYLHPDHIPYGWYVHGERNPAVSCSSPQSALYAFRGKEEVFFMKSIIHNLPYHGDVHIEPQHGTNITYDSLLELAKLLHSNQEIATLGNRYFPLYVT